MDGANEQAIESGFQLSLTNITWVMGALLIASSMGYFSFFFLQDDDELLFVGRLSGAYAVFFWITFEVLLRKGKQWMSLCGILSLTSSVLAAGSVLAIQYSTGPVHYFLSSGEVSNEIQWFWRGPYPAWGSMLVLSLIALARIRFLPLWITLLLSTLILSLDIYMKTFEDAFFFDVLMEFSITFGLVVLTTGFLADYLSKFNHGFWMNKIGLLVFSYGMGDYFSDGDYAEKYIFLGISMTALIIAVFQRRQGGAGFGFLGLLTFLAWQYDISGAPIVIMVGVVILGTIAIFLAAMVQSRGPKLLSLPRIIERLRPPARKDPITFAVMDT